MAACVEAAAIVRCFCPPGYSGPGVGPAGCVPGSGSGPSQGPVAPGSGGGGVVVSPCASRPCQNGATCIPAASTYTCACPYG